uniref:Uncharacterized protein n=1 Tax=Peronospora matthiolae TaxID=2874970 RepID=A0AAV1VGX0_9STRA
MPANANNIISVLRCQVNLRNDSGPYAYIHQARMEKADDDLRPTIPPEKKSLAAWMIGASRSRQRQGYNLYAPTSYENFDACFFGAF